MHRNRLTAAGVFGLVYWPLAGAPVAAAERVDLELVLAADVSGSMDQREVRLQREGYRRALTHPDVIQAILAGRYGRIGVTYLEWAGARFQNVIVKWSIIRDRRSAGAFADALRAAPIVRARWTAIGSAMVFSVRQFVRSPFRSSRKVLDISGDGPNNAGANLAVVRRWTLDQGIVINGLAIAEPDAAERVNGVVRAAEADHQLIRHYRERVIGGPGSFLIIARGVEDFSRAIRIKLVREISGAGDALAQQRRGDARKWGWRE